MILLQISFMPHSPNADIRLRFFIWQFQVGKKIIPSLHVSAAHFLKIVFVCFYSKGKRRLIEEKIRRRFLVLLVAGHCHSVLNISSPIKMSVGGILYGGYSYSYQSDFARKTFLCTRRVPQNQVSHSYQYLLATEEKPCFSMGYMNIILQKAQKSIVCCLSGAVPFGSAPLFLFQGGNNYVRVSIRIKANRGLSTLPDLPTIYRAADEG